MINRVHFEDVLSTALHSRDFDASRAEYITARMRLLALAFALLAPLWIPIDYLVMDRPTFVKIMLLRLAFSASFLLLSRWKGKGYRLPVARFRIVLFVAIPGLFFLASHLLLDGGSAEHGVLAGYSFLPFLIMALLGVVPLTLLEGISVTGLVIAFFVFTKVITGNLLTIPTQGDLWLLALLATVAMWVQMAQLHMLLHLYREATCDALTGLVNRRVLATKLQQEIELSRQADRPLSLLLFDLDLFKRINDAHGHHAGDRVLQHFSEILLTHCHKEGLVGRYGGEEFLALLPGVGMEQAHEIAESIRHACTENPVRLPEERREVRFTTSIGVALHKANERADELLARVDESLYRAKILGRNLVSIAE